MKFRRAFKPTMDERLDDHLRFYALILDGYENKWCTTCTHRRIEECKMWNGLVDYDLMCSNNEDVTLGCDKYEKDLSVKEDVFNTIKDFILNEYKEE